MQGGRVFGLELAVGETEYKPRASHRFRVYSRAQTLQLNVGSRRSAACTMSSANKHKPSPCPDVPKPDF